MIENCERLRRFAIEMALIAVVGLFPLGQVRGQEPAASAAPQPPAAVQSEWERLIYVPYRNLKQVFEKEDSTVLMPYGRFLKLWERLQRIDLSQPAKPPVNAVITSAAYTGRIEKDVARINVELTIQVLGTPWVEVPIQFGEAAIGKMTASDDKVLLQGTGNGAYSLLFPKPGEHTVKLELATRIRSSPDGRSLDFDCPAAGITTFDLSVPAGDQSVEIVPQGVQTTAQTDENSTRVKASLGATKKIVARWRPRVSTAPVMEVLTSVHNTLDVRIADGLVHTHATLTYQVLRGQLDQIRVAVPLEHRVLDVTTPGLKSWKAVAEQKSQVLTIDLLGGESKSIVIEVHTERPAPTGAFEPAGVDETGVAHGIHALGDVRENGLLVIGQSSDLSLTVEQQSGLVRVEAAEVPEALRRPETLFYKFYTPKFALKVVARPVEPRLLVEHLTQLVFRDDELQLTSQLQYEIERAGVFELRFKLPAGLKIDRVVCDEMKEFQTPEGADQLIVSLQEKTEGQIVLEVVGHLALDPNDKESHPLPLLEPLATSREDGTLAVYAPESLEVIADEKGVQGAQPTRIDPNRIARFANARLVSAWAYNRHPEIPVHTQRKPTRLSAAVATVVNLRQDLTEVTTLINYNVLFAGIDTFRFAVPEGVADSVQIETIDAASLPIKQKSRDEQAVDGWVTWTLVLQRDVTGLVPIRVRYDLKSPVGDDQKIKQTIVPVQLLRVLETPGKDEGDPAIVMASVSGEIIVQKDRALSVAAKADDLEPIDVRELTLLPSEGYLAYRYFKQPEQLATSFTLELTETRNDIQPVVETVVDRALIEAVVTEDKSVTYRCRYRLRTSERQRLSLDLPENAEILDTLVAGKRVKLEKGAASGSKESREWDSFYVNVARSTPSDEPFVMALVFRAPFTDFPLRGQGGNLRLRLPRLGGTDESGQPAVALQQLRTALWVPREFALVGTPEGFTPEQTTELTLARGAVGYASSTQELENWFGDSAGGLFAFTPAGKAYLYHRLGAVNAVEVSYWRTAWYTWMISAAVALVAFVLVRTSWENRLTLVLVAALAAALYALRDADIVVNVLGAARFGLLAMGAYWLIHALTRPRPKTSGITFRSGDPAAAVSALGAVLPPPGLFDK
ncbi:MAG: hypothetical protein EXS05_00985 [Planctomycetaceae bacterium]|nr:hypothetical protein [Planctomycetaceae bacterium]